MEAKLGITMPKTLECSQLLGLFNQKFKSCSTYWARHISIWRMAGERYRVLSAIPTLIAKARFLSLFVCYCCFLREEVISPQWHTGGGEAVFPRDPSELLKTEKTKGPWLWWQVQLLRAAGPHPAPPPPFTRRFGTAALLLASGFLDPGEVST